MNSRDVLAGTFLFLLGAAAASAYFYRKEIKLYLGLQKDGTIDAVSNLATGFETLYKKFSPPAAK